MGSLVIKAKQDFPLWSGFFLLLFFNPEFAFHFIFTVDSPPPAETNWLLVRGTTRENAFGATEGWLTRDGESENIKYNNSRSPMLK